jgi:hypothetical protein
MWYNGDYVFYDLLFKTDFDYFVICEYDLAVNTPLTPLAHNIILSNCDFVASQCNQSDDSWEWHSEQKRWDIFERDVITTSKAYVNDIYGCFFPFICISRQAVIWLYSRRIHSAKVRSDHNGDVWPFCETFVPTELARAGFTIANLDQFVSGPVHMTTSDAYSWTAAAKSKNNFIHPVFLNDRLANKLFEHAALLKRMSGIDEVVTLTERLNRCGTETEVALLEAKIMSLQGV